VGSVHSVLADLEKAQDKQEEVDHVEVQLQQQQQQQKIDRAGG